MNHIEFLTAQRVWQIIANNSDHFQRFCPADFKARGVRNLPEYLLQIAQVISEFDVFQQKKLRNAATKADQELKTICADWFDGKQAARIKWRFGCTDGDGWAYENGLPHTVGRMIVVSEHQVNTSSHEELVRLLMHEKTHVYQRAHPGKVRNYLRQRGFRPVKRQTARDGIRANPDTDGMIYERMGEVYAFPYRRRIRDLHSIRIRHNRLGKEHPCEEMAYTIERWSSKKL